MKLEHKIKKKLITNKLGFTETCLFQSSKLNKHERFKDLVLFTYSVQLVSTYSL